MPHTGQEKRQFPRIAIRQDAVLVVAGQPPVVVTLENVCEGGAFASGLYSDRLRQILDPDRKTPVSLHVFVGGNSRDERPLRLMGRCVRVQLGDDGAVGVGLAFDAPIQTLSRWAREVAGQVRSLTPREREALEGQLKHVADDFFQSLVVGLLDELKARLDDRLSRAESFQAVNAVRDAQVVLMEQRGALARAFNEALSEGWEGLYQGVESFGRGRTTLEVVDKRAFEQWLELQMIGSAVANRFREPLFRLHQVLSAVFRTEVDERINPFGPRRLCEALQEAFARVPELEALEQDLPGAFEQVLIERLPGLYDYLLEHASAAGVRTIGEADLYAPSERGEPGRLVPARRTPVNPLAGHEDTDKPPVPGSDVDGSRALPDATVAPVSAVSQASGSGRYAGRRARSVMRLAEVVSSWEQSPSEPGQTQAVANPADVLPRIGQALQQRLQTEAADKETSVQAQLEALLEDEPELAGSGGPVALNLATIVDRLFNVLSEASVVDELVNRLRLPLFELILEDMGFLDDRSHPVRRLLDDIANLTSSDQAASGSLKRTLEPIVDGLAEGRFRDPGFVEDALQRVHRLVERQERAFLRNAERIARTHAGREKLERARKAVRYRLDALLRDQAVPRVLLELLEAGWEQLMVLAVLKEGPDSVTYSEHFAALGQLMDWLTLDDEDEDALYSRDLEAPALLDMLDRELATAAEPARVHAVMRALRQQLEGQAPVERVDLHRYPPDGEDDETAQSGKVIHVAPERWRRRATELKVGDWIELELKPGHVQRMRLVWVSDNTYKFVFLAQNGLQELEIPLDDMAQRLADGRARRSDHDSISLVDRGLYDAIQALYARMASQATHDPLTGCVQRREFEKHLERVVLLTRHAGADSALILFDLDKFRLINTQYGTSVGDRLLQRVPRLLDEKLKPHKGEMLLGRSGSNEFGLLLYPCTREQALDMAHTIVRAVESHREEIDGHVVHTTASAGVVLINAGSPNASTLLTQASHALNARKEGGGNGWQLYQEDDARMQKEAVMMRWASRLDRPFDEGDLCLTAQLIRSLEAEAVCCEVLLQVRDEKGRPSSPVTLIEAAERFGRIVQLDKWIVEGTLKWMQASPATLARIHHVNINLSGHSLSDDRFLDWLDGHLSGHANLLSKLCFEVTETAAISQVHYTRDFMAHLRRKGVRFALDDFGTGLSSYAYLQQLPVDYLKIDGVFVKDIDTDLTHYAMVKSINELGHFMGLETIAEFVESSAIVESLRELGVDWAQGYHFSRPVALEHLADAIAGVLKS